MCVLDSAQPIISVQRMFSHFNISLGEKQHRRQIIYCFAKSYFNAAELLVAVDGLYSPQVELKISLVHSFHIRADV